MSKRIKEITMLLLFVAAGVLQGFAFAGQNGMSKNESPETVIVELTLLGYTANWTPMTGTAPYHVTVFNMTTATLHTQFYTMNTSAPLTGLVNGNTYSISIARGSQVDSIIVDIIDL